MVSRDEFALHGEGRASLRRRTWRGATLAGFALLADPRAALAQSYRLRADVFAEAPDPSGFVMLQGDARTSAPISVDAEAMVWTGVGTDSADSIEGRGEAVLVSVRVHDVARLWEVRLGRQLFGGGAVRPLYFDGAVAGIHAPSGTGLEVFGGIPVALGFEGRSYDWLLGQRLTQAIGKVGRFGVSYFQERDDGRVALSEIGVEGALFPMDALAVTGTAAVDVERIALAQARVSATLHGHTDRLELFGVRRSPDHLLPATSLFAALGGYDADALGLTGFMRIAPRLDLSATATLERVGDEPAATQSVRAELRLDDEGRGLVGVDLRRESVPEAAWTGARAWFTWPLMERLLLGTELEVAVPDSPRDRGVAWPWAFLSLRYRPLEFLELAGGFEASSTPADEVNLGGLLRASGTWAR